MNSLDLYMLGWSNIFSFWPLLLLFVGVIVGVIFGALPGLGATAGVAIVVPLTYGMDLNASLSLLLGIFCGAIFGGSISATLINIPGVPAAMMTVLEAYPLARAGKAGLVLAVSTISSFLGGIFSAIMLAFFAPLLASWALRFGPQEYFMVALLGISVIVLISGDSMPRALFAGFLGLLLATVGEEALRGFPRYAFGVTDLRVGLHFIPVSLGLYGMAQVFNYLIDEARSGQEPEIIRSLGKITLPFRRVLSLLWVVPRNAVIGTIVGALPGTGATIGAILSYGVEKRISRTPEAFGKGHLEAIVATETSNNATIGGAMIPLLALGIPGDATTAIILGAFILHGVAPGPTLFLQQPDLVSSIFVIILLANVIFLIVGLAGARIFPKLLSIPKNILMTIVALLCMVGAFSVHNNAFDIGTMVVFGVVGYLMRKAHIPIAPLLLTLILGPLLESNIQRAAIIDPTFIGFLTSPISLSILIAIIAMFAVPPIIQRYKSANALPVGEDKETTS
ncbi:MAG: C4-dicarboxylate ABC transporter permease [Rhizobiaceae bacterium MnEN-MB40S]|nr:MAG: C4-dicarboxylate ABC transporter permease [Rhizobiaceae bacterium MnEN-MB40S]